jgi:hypothetical protein
MWRVILVIAIAVGVASCQSGQKTNEQAVQQKEQTTQQEEPKAMSIELKSTAFSEGGMIPKKYTCDSVDVSPDLSWTGIPDKAVSLALICDDPDSPAGTWAHWVIYCIPAKASSLPEGVPANNTTFQGAKQGENSFHRGGYGGPCPPKGTTHRYFFKLYALDIQLALDALATKDELLAAMQGHVIGQGQLIGKYQRQ